jgi:hypothetical protein
MIFIAGSVRAENFYDIMLAAASSYLAVPTPVVSVATTPVLLTRLVIDKLEPSYPYPNIA